jgi:hypothetical protein
MTERIIAYSAMAGNPPPSPPPYNPRRIRPPRRPVRILRVRATLRHDFPTCLLTSVPR